MLADLGVFLRLDARLSERYETMWPTGKRGRWGLSDDSAEIRAGRIVGPARDAYLRCLADTPGLSAGAGDS